MGAGTKNLNNLLICFMCTFVPRPPPGLAGPAPPARPSRPRGPAWRRAPGGGARARERRPHGDCGRPPAPPPMAPPGPRPSGATPVLAMHGPTRDAVEAPRRPRARARGTARGLAATLRGPPLPRGPPCPTQATLNLHNLSRLILLLKYL